MNDMTPILMFINPKSGSGLANEIIDRVREMQNITIVKLPEEAETFAKAYKELMDNQQLRIIVAGGDGTINWVISLLNKHFGEGDTEDYRPPISVIPLGTGNDMSNALGWDNKMTKIGLNRLENLIYDARHSINVLDFDVFRITCTRTDTNEVITHQMLNYFSIGVDAEMAQDFEKLRNSCFKSLFCCHCMSKAMYLPIGCGNLFCKRKLGDYCTIDVEDNSSGGAVLTRRLSPDVSEKTIVFQQINSIYGGKDLWRSPEYRSPDDRKFEVIFHGGAVRLGLVHCGIDTGRCAAQGTRAVVRTTEPCVYQVDGEGKMMNGPCTFEISRVGNYPMVFRH